VIMNMLSVDPEARPSMGVVAESLGQVRSSSERTVPINAPAVAPIAENDDLTAKIGPPTGAQVDLQQAAAPSSAEPPDSLAAPAVAGEDQRPPEPRRRRGLVAAMALLVLIGIGIVLTTLLVNDRRAADQAAGSGESPSAAPTRTTAPTTTSPTSSAPATRPATSAPQQAPSPKSSAPTKSRTQSQAPPATSAPTVQGRPTAAQLRRAITSYYALMPRNTDAGWPRMTASYQTNHAGGRQAYQRFWDAINKINVTDVRGIPPGSAQATITYYFKDGRVVRERTAYGLINEDGRLKINSSTVLSSVTL
jgi:hypothetical protein